VNVEQPADGQGLHREALTIFERLDDRRGVAETLDLLGLARYMQADLTEAIGYRDRAIALFRELDDRAGLTTSLAHRAGSVTTYHSATAATLPQYQREATPFAEESLWLAQVLGWRASEAFARMILASILARSGEYGRALVEVDLALRTAEEIDHRQWICASLYTLAEIHRELFAWGDALHHFERALPLARELGSGNWSSVITGSLASTLLAVGDLPAAAALLHESPADEVPPATMGQRQLRLATAELALFQSQPDRALHLLRTLRGEPHTATSVDLLQARALRILGRLDEAAALLLSAHELATACQLASVTWRIQAELAAVLEAHGHGHQADAARTEALALVENLALKLPDRRLAETFIAGARSGIGIDEPVRHRRSSSPGGLTPREQEVAVLIARGHSNRAIAEHLVLSERTVEDHVSRILHRLGFTSRTQIASWATQQELRTTQDN
jgi:DNA-binding CsgD family transcriptional regulator